MTINQKIENALSLVKRAGATVPCAFIRYFGTAKEYMTYYTRESSSDFADDGCTDTVFRVSVAVFSDKNFMQVFALLKEKMTDSGFLWIDDSDDMYDEETKLFYKTADFEIKRSEI